MQLKKLFYSFRLLSVILLMTFIWSDAYCQSTLSNQYRLNIQYVDKDSTFQLQGINIRTGFLNQVQCVTYINQLPALLHQKGYMSASVDSLFVGSTYSTIFLFVGVQQTTIHLQTAGIEKKALEESGYTAKYLNENLFNFNNIDIMKERIVNYYESAGYPFAAVYLDSVQVLNNSFRAALKVDKGILYHIDSIRIFGKANIKNRFLQRYLNISNGSIYNKEQLKLVSKRLLELPYIQEQQPADLLMTGTGGVLNLYLQNKRNSQVNFLIGFLPANNETKKLQITGDVNLNLKNALGNGETILLNWQQLQVKSPRLNLGYQQPYIFKSAFGIDFSFNLFKKDSSFLQINTQLGVQYLLSANQSGKVFIQNQNTFLLSGGIDTALVRSTKKLPPNIDVSGFNIGVEYEWNNTNYKNNPRSGNEIKLITAVGSKKISKSNDITSMFGPGFSYASLYDSIKLKTYQLRIKLQAAHYFPTGKAGALKIGLNSAVFASQNIFRNELFQIGGYKLLRGFDEESIYATQYLVTTAEYRYLVGINSFLFGFADAGWVKNKYQQVNSNNQFTSVGLGLAIERKFGLLNVSLAIGKRGDIDFNLRQSAKIHFGYINYF